LPPRGRSTREERTEEGRAEKEGRGRNKEQSSGRRVTTKKELAEAAK